MPTHDQVVDERLTALDPTTTAVVVLDLQVDVVAPEGKLAASGTPAYISRHRTLDHVATLLDGARQRAVPIIHVHAVHNPGYFDVSDNAPVFEGIVAQNALIRGTTGVEPVPEATPQPGDIVIEKERMSGFHGTALDVKLRGLGVDTVVVCGAWTNYSVEHTCRHAADCGYRVVLATNATATRDETWQRAALDYALGTIGELLLVSEVLDAMDRRARLNPPQARRL